MRRRSRPSSKPSITSIRTKARPDEASLSKRRVVVTGLGIVSPIGNDISSAWASILAGRSGIGPVARFDAASFPTHFGGEIRDLDLAPYMSTKDARRMDAFMQYGVVAG